MLGVGTGADRLVAYTWSGSSSSRSRTIGVVAAIVPGMAVVEAIVGLEVGVIVVQGLKHALPSMAVI